MKNLEQAIEEYQVDTEKFDVDKYLINEWGGNKQIKIWLKRKYPNYVDETIDNLLAEIKNHEIETPKIREVNGESHLLELSLFDAHFGKLCWRLETGTDYDLKLAEKLYLEAIDDLLARIQGFNIERILLPIGQDFFHVNNWANTTAKGTPQDVDGRIQKVFEVGCNAVIKAIEKCIHIAPVEVLWVPGNHDPETSWYLLKFLEAWYHNSESVTVDRSPKYRKYKQYGVNLLGFTHGNDEPINSLPTIMAAESPDEWAVTEFRTWHIGHWHHKSKVEDTFNGVTIAVLPSISGTDAWHYRKGYIKNIRAAECYLWGRESGYVGHFSSKVKA